MKQKHFGRIGRRLLTLPLAALMLAATAAAAQADYMTYNASAPGADRYPYVYLEPGQTIQRSAHLVLVPDGNFVRPGSSFTLEPTTTSVIPGGSVGKGTIDVPADWNIDSRTRTDIPVMLKAPDALGEKRFTLEWNPVGYSCQILGATCVSKAQTPTVYTINVIPRPVSSPSVDTSARGATVRWGASLDDQKVTQYNVARWNKATNGEYELYSGLAPGTTSISDQGLEPDTEYCWSIGAAYIDPTTNRYSNARRMEHCAKTDAVPTAPEPADAPPADGDGDFSVSWGASTHPTAGALSYTLERTRADGSSAQVIASGLSGTSHALTGEAEGTHRYRVKAIADGDPEYSGDYATTRPVKVDKAPPSAPQPSTREPDAAESLGGWFKDQVTVSWTGSVDPALADGTAGSGVERYSPDQTIATHGEHVVAGRAWDAAGHASAPGERTVRVDAKPPTMTIACPTQPINVGDRVSARWEASDEGSGMHVPSTGSVTLDTTSRGQRVAHAPVLADAVGHQTEPASCTYTVRSKPTEPGAPQGPAFDRDGTFDVTWAPSTDADGDAFTYQLVTRDSASQWTFAAFALTDPRFTTDRLSEGTWSFGVRAVESGETYFAATGYAISENIVKVDRTGPSAPTATTDPAGAAFEGWFKDSVTVSFGGSTDPALADGSAGSGVADYRGGDTFTATGTHTATGVAADRAGNDSAPTAQTVKVDATPPAVAIQCPDRPVPVGSRQDAAWTATDEGSGLATPATGTDALDTTIPGKKTATAPAPLDNVGHEGQTDSCQYVVNTPPTAPGGPDGPELDQDGTFDLTWAASSDADGDAVRYAVERRSAATGAHWVGMADGLTAPTLRTAGTPEGTYDYRVRASDPYGGLSGWAETADLMKVDGTPPSAPVATTAPSGATFEDWFKDSVTVSFGGSNDAVLPDGSPGSGLTGYTGDATYDTTGTHTATGVAADRAGNKSKPTEHAVKVDADAPTVKIACPSGTLIVGQPATAAWNADDEGSGLATPATGSVELHTSSPGRKTATAPGAGDRVGHQTGGPSCSYEVAYEFAGFSAPIDGDAVNAGKTGRTYPVKWRLRRHDGSLIPDADADALAASMSAGQRETSCDAFGLLPEGELTESNAAEASLRYDPADDQFVYNYKAPSTTGCYIVGIRNADGSSARQLNFSFAR